ncbi:hypothetical protein F511_19153 [Dorcoceras hygrometricum]|uniref:Uncharacterized protein n=1 Tax=Dorcoceras hygrometricum TaxID=472368 RepID=A0A2Z7BL83_9LAMI|nr:hypothetical protein F511_19153 [Dorcoceras hygrometricum]
MVANKYQQVDESAVLPLALNNNRTWLQQLNGIDNAYAMQQLNQHIKNNAMHTQQTHNIHANSSRNTSSTSVPHQLLSYNYHTHSCYNEVRATQICHLLNQHKLLLKSRSTKQQQLGATTPPALIYPPNSTESSNKS